MNDAAGGTPRRVTPAEAERLVASGDVRLLDVRTPGEFSGLGHIPGAMLLPVDLVAAAVATLPREGAPLLVYCEHGVRSAHAARLLARAGFSGVLDMAGGMSCWRGPRDHEPGAMFGPIGPASWLVQNSRLLPPEGRALDVACGRGRNALLMASAGFRVRAVDRDAGRIAALREDGARLGWPVQADVMDLEVDGVDLERDVYDIVLVIHYLHRPLVPVLIRALRPGGLLLYETFTVDQPARFPGQGPRSPEFLLQPGELARLVAPLEILERREGEFEGRMVSAVAARRAAR